MPAKEKQEKIYMLEHVPDVIFIGYQRAGSTFLRSYFTHHPGIQWTRTSDYFGSNEKFYSDEYAYCDLNAGQEKDKSTVNVDMYEGLAVGEITGHKFEEIEDKVFYVKKQANSTLNRDYFYPDPGEIAQRIKTALPGVKILIVIRNQQDWIRSNYLHRIIDLPKRNKRFYDYISTRSGKSVLFSGLYHDTIDTYYRLFGKENVHVMLLEQLKSEQGGELKKLCQFLGVDFVDFPREKQKMNKGPGNRVGSGIKKLSALGIGITKDNYDRYNLFIRLCRKVRFLDRDVLTWKDKAFIRSFYAASNCLTSELLGLDLSAYKYPL